MSSVHDFLRTPPTSARPELDRLNGPKKSKSKPSPQNLPRLLVGYRHLARVGIDFSYKHLLEMMEHGEFPRLVRLSANRVAWRWADIEAWAASREVVLRQNDAIEEV